MNTFRTALSNLWSHKLRSGLTVLGVLIGTMAVLAVVTIGQSIENQVVTQFDSIDDRTIIVNAATIEANFGPPITPSGPVFTQRDVDNVQAIPGVESIQLDGSVPMSGLTYADRQVPIGELRATTEEDPLLRELDGFQAGRSFQNGANEVVLGALVKEQLDRIQVVEIGDTMTLKLVDNRTIQATIVGILEEPTGLFGDGATDLFVPLDPFYRKFVTSPTTGEEMLAYGGLTVEVQNVRDLEAVREEVDAYFEPGGPSDVDKILDKETFQVSTVTPSEIQGAIGQTFDAITAGVSGIAIISLVVGAIGIANIMLVSVTERTKEIGTLKAIGAPNGVILRIFLLEAAIIGLVGAIIGTVLGLIMGSALAKSLFDAPTSVPIIWVVIALSVGTLTGVLAGFLPAFRATRIEIVKALSSDG